MSLQDGWMVFNGVSSIKAILSLLSKEGICLSIYLMNKQQKTDNCMSYNNMSAYKHLIGHKTYICCSLR